MSASPFDDVLESVRNRYQVAFEQHGDSPQGLLWHSEAAQQQRLDVIARLIDYSGLSVLDLGCGTGALYRTLTSKFHNIRYTGIELVPEIASAASSRHPEAEFIAGTIDGLDPTRSFDVVAESGVFNTADYTWEAMEWTVRAMWRRCKRATIFNLMSSLSTAAVSHDCACWQPEHAVALAGRLTRRFSFLHSYRDNDMTIVLFRDDAHPGTDQTPSTTPESVIRKPSP